MRIVYLHQYFNTPAMSGGTRSYEMARRLVAMGHSVVMIASDRDATAVHWRVTRESGIEVHWVPVRYSNMMSFPRRMAAFMSYAVRASIHILCLEFDLVFASSTPLTVAIPGLVSSMVKEVPFVLEVRDLWPKVPIRMGVLRNPILRQLGLLLECIAYRRSAAIVTLAPGMAEHIRSVVGAEKEIAVIPNGCDLDLFASGPLADQQLREAYEWLGLRPLVVYTGSLGFVNDPEYIAHLAASVSAIDSEVRFCVLGTGSEEQRLRERAASLGVLNESVHMMGCVPKTTVAAWLSSADVALSLIRDEEYFWENSVTNKFFDAIAAGTPVVANHWGWQSEVMNDASAGIVVSAHNFDDAARSLVALIRDSPRLDRMGANGRELALRRFCRDTQAAVLDRLLTRVACVSCDESR